MEIKFIKGFIPVTFKSGKGSISYVNIDKIVHIGEYSASTAIQFEQEEHYLYVKESIEVILQRIQDNRLGNISTECADNIML